MANAQFQTFDLSRVFQAAEAINGMKRQQETDVLQQRFLKQRISQGDEEAQRRKTDEEKAQRKQIAEKAAVQTSQILLAPNIKSYVEQHEPNLIAKLTENGIDWASLDDKGVTDHVTAMHNWANQELGVLPTKPAPLSAQGKVQADVRSGFLTPEQATTPEKSPNSYDEYVLAQKDPEFAQFLKSRKGKGFSMTLPDGTVVEMGGDGAKVGPGELSKPTVNNLQETIVNSSNRLDRLNQMMTSYKPEYLQAKGLVKAGASGVKDFLGMDVSPEDKKFLAGYGEFKATASQEFSATLKELSGTAASEAEVTRVMKGVPSDQDKSPTVFEAKSRATTKFITRAIMRANWALKNGIGIQSIDDLSKRMPLEGIDGVYESRANQIWQEMGGTPESKAKAIAEANKEFGLAR